jgi:hypothetical protein
LLSSIAKLGCIGQVLRQNHLSPKQKLGKTLKIRRNKMLVSRSVSFIVPPFDQLFRELGPVLYLTYVLTATRGGKAIKPGQLGGVPVDMVARRSIASRREKLFALFAPSSRRGWTIEHG